MGKCVGVIDYGLGNLRSITKALEFLGAKVILSSQKQELSKVSCLVLPGVGAFKRGMENLQKLGLIDFLREWIKKDLPFLGICLGLQLLFSESEEHQKTEGLNIIKGRVKRFSPKVKTPHMGWNQVKFQTQDIPELFKDIPNESFFYFVHSYYVEPEDKSIVVGLTDYQEEFPSVIKKENLWAVQFHPEKSSSLGLRLLKNFLDLC